MFVFKELCFFFFSLTLSYRHFSFTNMFLHNKEIFTVNSFFLFYSPIPYSFLFRSLSLTHTVLKNAFLESFETVSCNRKDIILRVWSHLGYTGVYWVSALGYGRLRETIEWKLVEELERNPEHLKKSSCNIKILPE